MSSSASSGADKENNDDGAPRSFPMTLSSSHHFIPYDELEQQVKAAKNDPALKRRLRNAFTNPPAELFLVRGPNYLREGNGGKNLLHLKIPSKEPLYQLIGVNMFKTSARFSHVADQVAPLHRFFSAQPADDPEALFPRFLVINWLMSPLFGWGKNHIVQHVFRLSEDILAQQADTAMENAFRRFRGASDAQKNLQLKYVFRVHDAPVSVKNAIAFLGGERPVLIGKALTTWYQTGNNYLEINSDVSSSKVASAINGTILKNVETLIMECSWLLEGQHDAELPERLLCKIRWIWNCVDDVVISLNEAGEKEMVN
jgi:hypothetical protein